MQKSEGTTLPDAAATGSRARPLSVEDRQSAIIDAVIPLLIEHGRDLTSKQIAEASCVAEGTIFRAFGDKDTLIEAAIEKFLDPEPLYKGLRAIGPDLPLEDKVHQIIELMQNRFSEIFRVMAAIGGPRPPRTSHRHVFVDAVTDILAPELEKLNVSTHRAAHIIRLVTFASAFPHVTEGTEFTSRELADIVLYGIAGAPDTPTNATPTNVTPTESQA